MAERGDEHFEELNFNVDNDAIEYGIWCDQCLLPSVIKIPIEMKFNGKPCPTQFILFCTDHEAEPPDGTNG